MKRDLFKFQKTKVYCNFIIASQIHIFQYIFFDEISESYYVLEYWLNASG